MDGNQFDALLRIIGTSRRSALGLVLAAGSAITGREIAGAGNQRRRRPCPPCRKRKNGRCRKRRADGVSCGEGGQVCLSGQCTCLSGQRFCQGACLPNTSDCCTNADCSAGAVCVNGLCGVVCTPGVACGTGCVCRASAEGVGLCVGSSVDCAAFPQTCSSTVDCHDRPGFFCVSIPCGGSSSLRCVGLC